MSSMTSITLAMPYDGKMESYVHMFGVCYPLPAVHSNSEILSFLDRMYIYIYYYV